MRVSFGLLVAGLVRIGFRNEVLIPSYTLRGLETLVLGGWACNIPSMKEYVGGVMNENGLACQVDSHVLDLLAKVVFEQDLAPLDRSLCLCLGPGYH